MVFPMPNLVSRTVHMATSKYAFLQRQLNNQNSKYKESLRYTLGCRQNFKPKLIQGLTLYCTIFASSPRDTMTEGIKDRLKGTTLGLDNRGDLPLERGTREAEDEPNCWSTAMKQRF